MMHTDPWIRKIAIDVLAGNYTDNLVILYLFGILFIRWHEMDDHACRVFFPKRFVGELLGNNDFIGGIEFPFPLTGRMTL